MFTEFLEEVNSVRLASIQEIPLGHNTNPPVLIHCDEGFERTGVTLVSDLLLYTLDHNQVTFTHLLILLIENSQLILNYFHFRIWIYQELLDSFVSNEIK